MPKEIPDMLMMRNNKTQRIDMSVLPSPDLAVQMYVNAGGSLTDPDSFGSDPISCCSNKMERLPLLRSSLHFPIFVMKLSMKIHQSLQWDCSTTIISQRDLLHPRSHSLYM